MKAGRAAERVGYVVHDLDGEIDRWFDILRGRPVADRVFYTASALGDFGLIWVMLALVRSLRGRPNDERAAARALVGWAIESVLVNAVVKSLFGRGRPVAEGLVHPLPFRQPLTSSFPSGHATAAFCAAVLLSDEDDLAPLYFSIALVVAVSRIYVKIHHASDVVAGMVVGAALGILGRKLSPLPSRKCRPGRQGPEEGR